MNLFLFARGYVLVRCSETNTANRSSSRIYMVLSSRERGATSQSRWRENTRTRVHKRRYPLSLAREEDGIAMRTIFRGEPLLERRVETDTGCSYYSSKTSGVNEEPRARAFLLPLRPRSTSAFIPDNVRDSVSFDLPRSPCTRISQTADARLSANIVRVAFILSGSWN